MATDYDVFENLTAENVDFLQPTEMPTDDIDANVDPDTPDPTITQEPKRTLRAKRYEKKIGGIFGAAARTSLEHPATIADGAAMLYYVPNIAKKLGDLADVDDNVRKGIDFLTGGVENPYAAALAAVAPLVFQIIRNHEPVLEPSMRGLRIPFTKRTIKLKFGIKLGRLRQMFTHDPEELIEAALTRENRLILEHQGVKIASRKRARKDS